MRLTLRNDLLLVFASLLITFREALEAALIVSIVSAYLRKIGQTSLNKYVYAGTVLAVAASISIGILVQLFYGGLTGASAELFGGAASLLAAAVLTYMIFWMARNSKRIKGEIEQKVDMAVSKGQIFGIASLSFVAVVREGIETVLFLTALFFVDPSGTAVGMMIGLALVVSLSILILRRTRGVNVRSFFKYSSILLIVLAAGLAGYGVHELLEAAEAYGITLGILGQQAFNINPSDTTNFLHERGALGSFLRAMVGYDGNPEWLRVIVYVGYWLVVGAFVWRTFGGRHASQAATVPPTNSPT